VFFLARLNKSLTRLAPTPTNISTNSDPEILKNGTSASPAIAKEGLMKKFGLSDLQAQAILDMRLHRLTGLEQDKINAEYAELIKLIEKLKQILANEKLLLEIIINELKEVKEKYADKRRTEIIAQSEEINVEDMIVEENMIITVSNSGYIKRNPVTLYRTQQRGGKGVTGMTTKEEDFCRKSFCCLHPCLYSGIYGQG